MTMMTCRDVSTTVASGHVGQEPLARRLQIWMHLVACPPCRRFWQQIRALDRAVSLWLTAVGAEAPADLAIRVAARLGRLAGQESSQSAAGPQSRGPQP